MFEPARILATLVVLGGLGSLSGCTGAGSTADSATQPTRSAVGSPSPTGASATSPTTSSAASPAPTGSGGVPGCRTSRLSITVHGVDGGLSHAGYSIRFRNRSQTTCVIGGYPGVDGATSDGHAVVHAQRTGYGYLGGGRRVRVLLLAPGATAAALYEGQDARTDGGPPCPQYSVLVITPPANTVAVRIARQPTLCYPQIHPIVRGSDGRKSSS